MSEVAVAGAVVLTERRGRLGVITLNRPPAINALSHEMVSLVADAWARWEPAIHAQVTSAQVAAAFTIPDDRDLILETVESPERS